MLISFFRLSLFLLLTIWIWNVFFSASWNGEGGDLLSFFFFLTSYCRALDLICPCFLIEFHSSISSFFSRYVYGSVRLG